MSSVAKKVATVFSMGAAAALPGRKKPRPPPPPPKKKARQIQNSGKSAKFKAGKKSAKFKIRREKKLRLHSFSGVYEMNGILRRNQSHNAHHEAAINGPTRASCPDAPYTLSSMAHFIHHDASPFGYNNTFRHK
jgi:hypothetical protein